MSEIPTPFKPWILIFSDDGGDIQMHFDESEGEIRDYARIIGTASDIELLAIKQVDLSYAKGEGL